MWTVIISLHLLVRLNAVLSSPPSPVNVFFSSINLRNVLQWHAGNGSPPGTHYTVQYAIYGDRAESGGGRRVRWRVVRQCIDVGRSWCDLTNETSDLEEGYFARVQAVGRKGWSRWTQTQRRFDPYTDTSFGPPSVAVTMVDVDRAVIRLKGPTRWCQDNHTPAVSMATLYRQMTYILWVHNTKRNQTRQAVLEAGQSDLTYRLMDYETEYCVSARADLLLPILFERSAWHCLTTTQDPVIGQLHRVVVGIVVASLCVCVLLVAGYLLNRAVRGTDKTPDILLTLVHVAPPTFFPEVLDPRPAHPKPQPPIPDLPDVLGIGFRSGYAPQRNQEPDAPWEKEVLEEVEYGFVSAAPAIVEGGEGERDERSLHEREGKVGGREGLGRNEGEREERSLHEREGKVGGREGLGRNEGEREERRGGVREGWERRGERETGDKEDMSQAPPYILQNTLHTHTPTHIMRHTQTSSPHTHTNKDSNSEMGGEMKRRMNRETETRRGEEGKQNEGEIECVCKGVFIVRDPQTGLFKIPLLDGQMKEEEERGLRRQAKIGPERRMKGEKGGMKTKRQGGAEREEGASCNPYTVQSSGDTPCSVADQWRYSSDMPCSVADQWRYSSDHYGVLGTEQDEDDEEEDEDDEEEDVQINCVHWNPLTGVLVFPETRREERERECRLESVMVRQVSEEEEEEERERVCRLESVMVRQVSEEEEERERVCRLESVMVRQVSEEEEEEEEERVCRLESVMVTQVSEEEERETGGWRENHY